MGSKVDVFGRIGSSSVLAKPGHRISCFEDGYDAHSTYSAERSCGWDSISVSEYVPDWPLDPRLLAFAEKYGHDALHMGEAVTGSSETVVREVLAHLDLPLGARIRERREHASSLVQRLTQDNFDADALKGLSDLARDVQLLEAAEGIMATVEIPVLQPVSEDAKAEYAAIQADIYPNFF